MADMQVYALKGDPDTAKDVYASLKEGVGRFGWSYMTSDAGQPLGDADLRRLKAKIEATGWASLTTDEQARYQGFLLELKEGDWVIYVNVPSYGRCTVVRVAGPYYWSQENSLDGDFNHRFPVDPASVREFDRNDVIVHPRLSARLKLQGRFWRIYTLNEFQDLIRHLDGGRQPEPRTSVTSANLLGQRIEPLLESITQQVQHTHPNVDLEGLLKLVFENMDSVAKVTWQGGRGDYGADLIVVFEDRLPYPLQRQHTCVVQAKSYEGKMWDKRAVEDIRRAFDRYPAASTGLIVSTADSTTPEVEEALEDLRKSSGKQVHLLVGSDVARFILRYGGDLLGGWAEGDSIKGAG